MKSLAVVGALTVAATLAFAAPPTLAQERVCVQSERDGRVVCGRRVRDYDDNFSNRDDRSWGRSNRNQGDRQCGSNFDENFYLTVYPDVATAVTRGQVPSACFHYLTFGRYEGRLPQFSESSYLSKNPDVANAVRRGQFRSGYDHWLKIGRFENRTL